MKHDSAHTDHVTIQNYKRNVLRTPANNKIRLDDERGKEHIKVSTEYGGKSQLNLDIWWMLGSSSAVRVSNCAPICGVR